jgi:nucleoside-diphosphate-sugar epimerase
MLASRVECKITAMVVYSLISNNLQSRVLKEGHEVHLLLRKGYSRWRIDSIQDEVNSHIVDLNDVEALGSSIASIRPDWVFHLAAYGAYSSQSDLRRMTETNLVVTANLVDACTRIGFEAFINTGSSSEYGLKNHAPSENELIEPNSFYAVTKAAATHYCRFIAQSRNASLTTLRLYSVFGPYEEPTRLIPTLIVEGLKGCLPSLVNPSVSRDYIFIQDVLDAYILAASNPAITASKIYNIGTGVQTSLREVVDLACLALPIKDKPEWGTMPDRQWDTSIWVADHTSITKDLGWQPRYSLGDGFKLTVDWLKSNQSIFNYYQSNRALPC